MAADTGNVVGSVAGGTDTKAYLEVLAPESKKGKQIHLCFNPTELQLAKQNTFAEVAIPGRTTPPVQFVRGASEKLTFEAIVDTSDSMKDVRDEYVNDIRNLMNVDPALHAPPILQLIWNGPVFVGVLESLSVTYTLFSTGGKPVRAKLSIGLKEYPSDLTQPAPSPPAKNQSSDVEKAYVVQRTDTLSRIAEQAYGDPAPWREIARANRISDPRTLEPGTVLTIPRLTTEPA